MFEFFDYTPVDDYSKDGISRAPRKMRTISSGDVSGW
jgi:hypothetical protein